MILRPCVFLCCGIYLLIYCFKVSRVAPQQYFGSGNRSWSRNWPQKHFYVVFWVHLGLLVWDTAPSGGFLVPVTVVLPLRHSHVAAHRREVSSLSHWSHWVSCPECEQKIHRRTQAPPTPSPRWLIPLESSIRNGGNGSFHCEESTHLEGKRSSFSLSEMNVFVCWATGNNSDLFVRSSTSKGGKGGAALTQETETYFPSGKIQPFTGLTCSYKYS